MLQLSVIGLGVAENARLNDDALIALQQAELVVGSARQLLTLKNLLSKAQKTALLPKLADLKSLLSSVNKVAILGSGDPLYYGIGRWLSEHFSAANCQFFPAISSITQACHCLGIAQQDVSVLSLHGRPLLTLNVHLKAQQSLLILTDKYSQPQHLAALCIAAGFTQAKIVVCECLGYAGQKISELTAQQLSSSHQTFDPLHLSFIFPGENHGYLPEFPGIKDQHFITGELGAKGLISKREVRLAILSLLQLRKDDLLWDIGAGCGAVAVELAYWQPQATIYAIECHPSRFDCLQKNIQKFGVVSNLLPIFGRAPEILSSLPVANKVFIGGSDGQLPLLLDLLWAQLPLGGQVVASAVMETSKAQLLSFYMQRIAADDSDVETLQIAINKGDSLAGQLIYRPALAVNLFSFVKREKR